MKTCNKKLLICLFIMMIFISAGMLCSTIIMASDHQTDFLISQAEDESFFDSTDTTIENMKKFMQSIKEDEESTQKYKQEMEKIKQLKLMFDELSWIIQKNDAYIKDWHANRDCIVGKQAVSIIDKDIEYLQNQLNKIQNDCQQCEPVEQPNLSKLCQEKSSLLSNTIEDYKNIQDEFRAKCKSK